MELSMRNLTLNQRQVLTNLLLYGSLPRYQYQSLWTLIERGLVWDNGERVFLTEAGVNEARETLLPLLKELDWEL